MERTSTLCQGAFLLWVGEWVPDGFRERRGKKGGHEGPVEVGNWYLNKGAEAEGRVLRALPSWRFQTSRRCHSSWWLCWEGVCGKQEGWVGQGVLSQT